MTENISKLTLNGSVYDIKDNVTQFKTINGQSIKGEGNIVIENDTDLTNYYTKTESDSKYALKGDIPTDVYTKEQVDDKLSDKLDATAYTKYDDTQVKADIQANTTAIEGKQDTLVSGTNVKTINGKSILGEGNITIESGGLDEPTEQLLSTSLVDLNDRKADVSELSKYQKKGDYATKTDVAAKANSTDVFDKNYIEEIEKTISASLNELNERLKQLENK